MVRRKPLKSFINNTRENCIILLSRFRMVINIWRKRFFKPHFVKLWEIHPQVNPQKSILFYLSSIAKNMLFNRYQRQTIEFLYQENLAREKSFCDNDIEKEID